ncbi:MAG: hypothetical protein ACJ73W_05875 [Rubrobacteraceae bacterium]
MAEAAPLAAGKAGEGYAPPHTLEGRGKPGTGMRVVRVPRGFSYVEGASAPGRS